MNENNILEVNNLWVSFKSGKKVNQVLKGTSFYMEKGEIVGLCGESGSGKSTIAKAVLGMVSKDDGEIFLRDNFPQMIFQDPFNSLNPAKKVGWIIEEPLRLNTKLTKTQRREKVLEIMDEVELEAPILERRPAELSGGQRQRICIAAALINNPSFVIADEPVSALDVTIQKQILELLIKLKNKRDISILFISHDLKTMYNLCDRVLVLYKGEIVEAGKPEALYKNPQHPYTKILLKSAGIIG